MARPYRNFARCAKPKGDPTVIDNYTILPTAKKLRDSADRRDGLHQWGRRPHVRSGDHGTRRRRAAVTDTVDHAAGIADLVKIGEPVTPGMRLTCTSMTMPGSRRDAHPRSHHVFSHRPIEPLVQDLVQ